MIRRGVAIVILLFLCSAAVLAGEWPMFRHDVSNSGSSDEGVMLPLNRLWEFTTGGPVGTSPAVSGGIVYIGSSDHKLYALDAATGTKRWEFVTSGEVWSSPLVSDGVVYIGSDDGNVYALNAITGEKLWEYVTGAPVWGSSPTVTDGVVYVGSKDRKVHAIDAGTGNGLWTFSASDVLYSSPAVVGDIVYVGSHDGNVYALDAATGSEVWTFQTGSYVMSSPSVAGGVVYIGSSDHKLYALDAETGEKLWEYGTGHWVRSSPAVSGGVVYVGSRDSKLYALDAGTGQKQWEYLTGGVIYSSPAVAGDIVYVGSHDGNIYAFNTMTGEKLWEYRIGDVIDSSPAVANGVMYVGSADGKIYAFSTPCGDGACEDGETCEADCPDTGFGIIGFESGSLDGWTIEKCIRKQEDVWVWDPLENCDPSWSQTDQLPNIITGTETTYAPEISSASEGTHFLYFYSGGEPEVSLFTTITVPTNAKYMSFTYSSRIDDNGYGRNKVVLEPLDGSTAVDTDWFANGRIMDDDTWAEKALDVESLQGKSVKLWIMIKDEGYTGSGNAFLIDAIDFTPTPKPQQLISHWRFDEGSGTTVSDSQGDHDGTTHGEPNWMTGVAVSGVRGKALEFDGENDYIEVADSESLDFNMITVEAWIKPTDIYADGLVILRKQTKYTLDGFEFYITNNNEIKLDVAGSQFKGGHFPTGKWAHVAGTYDGDTVRLYVNGEKVLDETIGGSFHDSSAKMYIGQVPGPERVFKGRIDEVRLYDYALSETDIQQHYANEGPEDCTDGTHDSECSSSKPKYCDSGTLVDKPSECGCTSGYGDCDGTDGNGCEVNTDTDVSNCGSCVNACQDVSKASEECLSGSCAIDTCDSSYADCDGTYSNGCEVHTNTDVSNCGSCGNTCQDVSKASETCSSGSCAIDACDAVYADCDGQYVTGCEVNTDTDSSNCGACGTVCTSGKTCSAGGCICTGGKTDCSGTCVDTDTDPANCGTCNNACPPGQVCASSSCSSTCPDGTNECSGSCVNMQTDDANCGACGTACMGGKTCRSGTCLCPSGTTDCAGTCVDTNTDEDHCGGCGNVCEGVSKALVKCLSGSCVVDECYTEFADCDGVFANGCEVNNNTDSSNCGACGTVCTSGKTCSAGGCICTGGKTDCSGTCVDTDTDPANCGTCNNACPPGQVCASSSCSSTCPDGTNECSGSCVNMQTDDANCGACGTACMGGKTCRSGTCLCPSGITDCAGACVDLQIDADNCGGCGTACNGGATCLEGTCSCPGGETECLRVCTDTSKDSSNCGSCGNVCPSSSSCEDSVCKFNPTITPPTSTPTPTPPPTPTQLAKDIGETCEGDGECETGNCRFICCLAGQICCRTNADCEVGFCDSGRNFCVNSPTGMTTLLPAHTSTPTATPSLTHSPEPTASQSSVDTSSFSKPSRPEPASTIGYLIDVMPENIMEVIPKDREEAITLARNNWEIVGAVIGSLGMVAYYLHLLKRKTIGEEKVVVRRGKTMEGNAIKIGIKVKNDSTFTILDVKVTLDYPKAFKIEGGSPTIELGNIRAEEYQSAIFHLVPTRCVKGTISGHVTYEDNKGRTKVLTIEPVDVGSVCPFLEKARLSKKKFKKKIEGLSSNCKSITLETTPRTIFDAIKARFSSIYTVHEEINPKGTRIIGEYSGRGAYSKAFIGTCIEIVGNKDEEECNVDLTVYGEEEEMVMGLLSELVELIEREAEEDEGEEWGEDEEEDEENERERWKFPDEIILDEEEEGEVDKGEEKVEEIEEEGEVDKGEEKVEEIEEEGEVEEEENEVDVKRKKVKRAKSKKRKGKK